MIYTPHHIKGNAHALWYKLFYTEKNGIKWYDVKVIECMKIASRRMHSIVGQA